MTDTEKWQHKGLEGVEQSQTGPQARKIQDGSTFASDRTSCLRNCEKKKVMGEPKAMAEGNLSTKGDSGLRRISRCQGLWGWTRGDKGVEMLHPLQVTPGQRIPNGNR